MIWNKNLDQRRILTYWTISHPYAFAWTCSFSNCPAERYETWDSKSGCHLSQKWNMIIAQFTPSCQGNSLASIRIKQISILHISAARKSSGTKDLRRLQEQARASAGFVDTAQANTNANTENAQRWRTLHCSTKKQAGTGNLSDFFKRDCD